MRLTHRFFHLVALALLLVGATTADAGAIFTTDASGSFVNANVYDSVTEVYLNGGPRANKSCTSTGLPTGWYIFRVTDPSGHVDLTAFDPPGNRMVWVENGVITSYSGTRLTGSGRCDDDVTVALYPFDPTPNPGGEYKVWLTPVAEDGSFEFTPSKSKTDNFKVVPPDTDPD